MAFRIEFAAAVEEHLKCLTARQRKITYDGIEQHLKEKPDAEMRNRKPMRPNPLATWEPRLGEIRVYYRVLDVPEKTVQIAAVGIKRRERVWVAEERVDL